MSASLPSRSTLAGGWLGNPVTAEALVRDLPEVTVAGVTQDSYPLTPGLEPCDDEGAEPAGAPGDEDH